MARDLPAPRRDEGSRASSDLIINLTLPVTRLGFGPFSIDPVEQFIGAPVSYFLEPLLRSPQFRRPSPAGPAVDVYPLRLPVGEGLAVPLNQWGELGFRNDRGILVLTVPRQAAGWVVQRFAGAIVRGPEEGLSTDGTARVTEFWIRLRPGMKAGVPLGVIGEVGVEAG